MTAFLDTIADLFLALTPTAAAPLALVLEARNGELTADADAPKALGPSAAELAEAEREIEGLVAAEAHELAIVARIDAQIESLDARANEAADEGDVGAIETFEAALQVQRRLRPVAERRRVAAADRRDRASGVIAEGASAAEAVQIIASRTALDAQLAPAALAAELAPMHEDIVTALEMLRGAARRIDVAAAAHRALHAERVELGGDVPPAVQIQIVRLNLAFAAAGDDPATLHSIVCEGDRWLPVSGLGLAWDSSDVTFERAFAELGPAWMSPKGRALPSARRAVALRSIRDYCRTTARTVGELTAFALAELAAAQADENRATVAALEQDPGFRKAIAAQREAQIEQTTDRTVHHPEGLEGAYKGQWS